MSTKISSTTSKQSTETIAARIKRLRTSRGITQERLAGEIHTYVSNVCRWEKNQRNPSPDDIKLLADFFGVSKYYLTYGEETPVDDNIIDLNGLPLFWRQMIKDMVKELRGH